LTVKIRKPQGLRIFIEQQCIFYGIEPLFLSVLYTPSQSPILRYKNNISSRQEPHLFGLNSGRRIGKKKLGQKQSPALKKIQIQMQMQTAFKHKYTHKTRHAARA